MVQSSYPTVVQTTYAPQIRGGIPGLLATQTSWDASTWINSGSTGIPFGVACSAVAGQPKACIVGGSLFRGIAIIDITQNQLPLNPLSGNEVGADQYQIGSNVALLTRGRVWVEAQADVLSEDPVYFEATGGTLSNSASGTAAAGSVTYTEQPDAGDTLTLNGTVITFAPEASTVQAATAAATSTSSTAVVLAEPNANVAVGDVVFDITTGKAVGTVQSVAGTAVTLAANASNAVGSGDTLQFSPAGYTGNVMALGETLGQTLMAVAAYVNASPDTQLAKFEAEAYPLTPGGAGEGSGANELLLGARTVGTAGNSLTVATSSAGATAQAMAGGVATATQIAGAKWLDNAVAGSVARISLNSQV